MTLTVSIASENDSQKWDDVVFLSPHGTIFHTWKWLSIVQKHTNTRLIPLMLYKGTQLVALYPVFIQKKGFISVAFSPPPRAYLLYLGPVIPDYETMKLDKREGIFFDVQQEVTDYLFSSVKCKYFRVRTAPGLFDARPLKWAGCSVDPQYTYRINLTQGTDTIWERFDRKLRVDINKAIKEKVEVRVGNLDDLLQLSDSISRRFREQGAKPHDYRDYLTDLFHEFHPANMKIYTAYFNGERVGGMVSLCFKQVMYLWIGIPKSDIKGISPNDLVQWEAIKWASENGYAYYEEMAGGDNPRLRSFKSKYNPDLDIWYSATVYSSLLYTFLAKLRR
jgi:hypothetical protein